MSNNLFNIGLSGLNAAQWGLTVTGNNISNASTPGYDVESVQYQQGNGQYAGSGFLGSGVQVATVARGYSQYLSTALNSATATGSALSTYYTQISSLNNLLGDPTSGVAASISTFFSGMQTVANNPSSAASRNTLISNAQSLANQINTVGAQYDQIRSGINTQITSSVGQINSLANQIATLNQQISLASAQGTGQPPNQLLDQRDQAVASLNQLVGVSVVPNNGSYSVFLGNGQPLVVDGSAYQLQAVASPDDPSEQSIAFGGVSGSTPSGTPQYLQTSTLTGGSLGGLLQFRSQVLDPSQSQLGSIATTFANQLNAQNALGLDLNGNPGGALFKLAAPTVYSSTLNTGSATVSAAFTNPSQATTDDYRLTYDGSQYTLTDTTTGASVGTFAPPTPPATSASVGGLTFTLSGTPNKGDAFSIQPTRGALDSFSLATTNGSAVAAAAPVLASAGTNNAGTATISQGTVAAGYTLPSSPITLTYDGTTVPPSLSGFPLGSNVSVNGGAPTTIVAGPPATTIPYSASSGATLTFNGITVQLSGTPANGDTFQIAANGSGSNDNRNALLMAGLVSAKVMSGGTATLATAYATYISSIGNQTQAINASNTAQTAVVSQITASQQSVSGVNLDEEATNLLKYQQMYQANSKVISTADTLFQTLLNL
jgi:flagellar hook-associated protein 1